MRTKNPIESINNIGNFSEKEKVWCELVEKFQNVSDRLGFRIDKNILDAVVAFNAIGLHTSASCEGHIDHGISAPWIDVEAPGQPEERFVNENKIFAEIAAKYGIDIEDEKRDLHHEAYVEAMTKISQNPETPEYKKWRRETKKLKKKAQLLLKEFYQNRNVPPSLRLDVYESGEGGFRIHNGGDDYRPVPQNLNKEERVALEKRLLQYREEMNAFAQFLKQKFFSHRSP